jgi:threonine/homoserine/homoserine lactone efflux protein
MITSRDKLVLWLVAFGVAAGTIRNTNPDWSAIGFILLGIVPTLLWLAVVIWLGSLGLVILKWLTRD